MSRVVAVAVGLAAVLASCAAAVAECPSGCMPWAGAPCARDDTLAYLQLTAAGVRNTTNMTFTPTVVKFAYSPVVDQLQAFRLDNFTTKVAYQLMADTSAMRGNMSRVFAPNYQVNETVLYLEGGGTVTEPAMPVPNHDSTAMVMEVGGEGRTCGAGQVAVANFLVFNMTMTDGVFKYAGTATPAIQTGFMPTCDKTDTCVLGDVDSKCLGRESGRKNCASCVPFSSIMTSVHSLHVWMAYYGSDANGRSFKSGSDNPLNFEEFAFDSVYKTVADSVRKH